MHKLNRYNNEAMFDFKFLSKEQIPIRFDLNCINDVGSSTFDEGDIRWIIWREDVFKKRVVFTTTILSPLWNPAIHFFLCKTTHLGKLL